MAHMFPGVLEYERVATEDGSDEDLKFQVREVLAHARPTIHENGFVRSLCERLRSLNRFD